MKELVSQCKGSLTKFKKFFEDSGQLIVLMTFKKDMKIFFIREMYAGEDRTNYPGHRVIESLYVTHHSDFKNMYFNIMIALKHFIENDTRASRKKRRSSFNVRINVAIIFQQQILSMDGTFKDWINFRERLFVSLVQNNLYRTCKDSIICKWVTKIT